MKVKIKLAVLFCVSLLVIDIYAANKPVLEMNFDKYSPVGKEIPGEKLSKLEIVMPWDMIKRTRYLSSISVDVMKC